MAVLAECDICGHQHRTKESLIGNSIRCKDCGVSFVVPGNHVITPEAYFEENGRLRRRIAVPAPSAWPRIATVLISLLLVVATALGLWGLIQLIRLLTPPAEVVASRPVWLKVVDPDNRPDPVGAIDSA